MRVMMRVEMDTERANAAARDGTLGPTISSILEEMQPEAAYFIASNGCRTGVIVADIADQSEMPRITEPWFLAFNARVEVLPAMTAEDVGKAGPAIEQAAKTYD